MAAADGSESLLCASDAMFDHVCNPCKTGNNVTEGKHYCQVCNEYLCDDCRDYHQRLSATASHTTVSGSNLTSSTTKAGPRLVIYCSCNRNQPAAVYCEDHKNVVCMSCRTVKHRKCKTEKVQQKSAGYRTSKLDDVLAKTTHLKSEFDRLLIQITKDAADLQSIKKSCQMEIAKFRKEMNTFLDSLEQKLLKELDEHAKEQQTIIDHHIASLTTASQIIDSDGKQLKDAKSDGRSAIMFTADIQASKNLLECDIMLRKVENDYKKPELAFENNKMLEKMLKDIDALGYITICYKEKEFKTQKLLMNMKVTSVKQVSVRQDDDKAIPFITGCTFMPNDFLVMCDYKNEKIKVLNTEYKLVDKLKFNSFPWNLSAVGNDKVIVTLPNIKQLQYVQVFPQMKSVKTVQLDKECRGIAVSDNKLFALCVGSGKQGCDVRIMGLDGKQKQRIDLEQTGSLKYPYPFYLSIDRINNMIFVSNRENPSSVTCLTFDGNIVYQCTSSMLKSVRGIYVDAEDNAYVCNSVNNSVHIIAKDGSHRGTLIGPADGLKYPHSIAVRERDSTLVTGRFDDSILLFQLS